LLEKHMSLFVRFIRENEGQDLIEYALLATFISVVAAVGATNAGTQLENWYQQMATYIATMAAKIP
jgi:Flp pilus assembly pilin Flp